MSRRRRRRRRGRRIFIGDCFLDVSDGIMTPYQVRNAQKAAVIEKELAKDPLSELDALWKLKK